MEKYVLELQAVLDKYRSLGISQQIDYDKFYLYSITREQVTGDIRYYNSQLMKKPYKTWWMLTNKLYICS